GPEVMLTFALDSCGETSWFHGVNSASVWYSVHLVGVAIRPRSDAKRCRLNSSNGTWGRSLNETVSCPVCGSGSTDGASFAWIPKPAKIMKTRYWLPGFGSPIYREPVSGPFSAGVMTSTVPIFDVSGHSLGSSLPNLAWASLQESCPSAASG